MDFTGFDIVYSLQKPTRRGLKVPKRGFDHQHRPPTCLSPTDWNAYPINKGFSKKQDILFVLYHLFGWLNYIILNPHVCVVKSTLLLIKSTVSPVRSSFFCSFFCWENQHMCSIRQIQIIHCEISGL